MAVAMVIDHDIAQHVHPRVVTVADTEFGRVSITTSTSADGKQWLSFGRPPPTPCARTSTGCFRATGGRVKRHAYICRGMKLVPI